MAICFFVSWVKILTMPGMKTEIAMINIWMCSKKKKWNSIHKKLHQMDKVFIGWWIIEICCIERVLAIFICIRNLNGWKIASIKYFSHQFDETMNGTAMKYGENSNCMQLNETTWWQRSNHPSTRRLPPFRMKTICL